MSDQTTKKQSRLFIDEPTEKRLSEIAIELRTIQKKFPTTLGIIFCYDALHSNTDLKGLVSIFGSGIRVASCMRHIKKDL